MSGIRQLVVIPFRECPLSVLSELPFRDIEGLKCANTGHGPLFMWFDRIQIWGYRKHIPIRMEWTAYGQFDLVFLIGLNKLD